MPACARGDDEDVAPSRQIDQRGGAWPGGVWLGIGSPPSNRHPHYLGPPRYCRSDAAEPDDAERRASERPAEQLVVYAPLARAEHPVALDDTAAVAEDEPDGVIGDILVIGIMSVADLDAARRHPWHVHPVIADGEAGDQAECGHLLDERARNRALTRRHHCAHFAEALAGGLIPQRQRFIEAGQ